MKIFSKLSVMVAEEEETSIGLIVVFYLAAQYYSSSSLLLSLSCVHVVCACFPSFRKHADVKKKYVNARR